MPSESTRPKFLTKNAVRKINEVEDAATLQDLRPVLQIISVKDVRNKKNMKDKLNVSDGSHKMIWIVKEKVNTTDESSYKEKDIIRLDKFSVKVVGKVKVIIPSTDFDIISSEIDVIIGKPKDFNPQTVDEEMDYEPEIPYKEEEKEEESAQVNPEDFEISDQSDVEMKETPVKVEQKDHEELPDVTPSPMKQDMDEDDDIYTPINALSPMNSDWIIKARVSKKYPVKEWSNARGNGKLLTFELVDKYGTQIQATVFNKAVEKFDPIIEQDKVYVFCKGQVKVANQKFTAIKNDYSLTFSPYSDVTLTEDDSNISKMAFNFSSLREVQSKGEGKTLDFVGVIISAGEISSIQLKNGGTKDKRDYEVIDNSEDGGVKTIVTLWGSNAKKFNFKQGSVVAFKGLRITNFMGLTLNGGDYTGVYDANELKLKETKTLSTWFKTIKNNLDSVKSLTETQEQNKKANSSNVRLISEINENVQNDLANDPSTRYYINARVEMIKNDQKMVYMACPSCKKKMSEEDSGYTTWRWERWDMTTQTPTPTYILSVKFSDGTGSIWVRVYGDSALPIMNQMTPEKFKVYLDLNEETREQEVKDQLNKLNHSAFSVMVKPSISEYNGQESLSYFASKVFDFSYKRNNDFLIERLTAYATKPDVTA